MASTMSVKSREKIALLVFLGLIILSMLGFGWYLLAGHSWNVAASNIDDTFGSMEGYTAIVYPGTQVPQTAEVDLSGIGSKAENAESNKAADAKKTSGSGSSADNTSKDASGSAAQEPTGGKNANESAANSGSNAENASDNTGFPGSVIASLFGLSGKTEAEATDNKAEATDSKNATDGKDAASLEEDGSASVSSETPAGSLAKKKTLSLEDAKKSYETKNATVFSLDTTDLGAYSEGVILKKGNHRFGVFSIEEPLSQIIMEKRIAYFKQHEVDFIVVIAKDKSYVKYAEGIDIVICTNDEELFVMGETQGGTFYVDTPEVGRIGAILISPSNVVSAKVIEAP